MVQKLPLLMWFAIAFGLLAGGSVLLRNDAAFRARSSEVTGVVKGSFDYIENGERQYRSTIAWVDAEGQHRTFTVAEQLTEGSNYTFRYDPKNPNDHSTGVGRVVGIILCAMGVIFALLGVGVLQRARKAAAKSFVG